MNFAGSYKDLIKPDKIHVLSISVFLKKMADTHGGVAANIAYTLALLGEKPILLGSVGTDAKGYMRRLRAKGVNTRFVHESQLPTAAFNVITDVDDNQVGGFYPGAMFDSQSLSFVSWKGRNVFCVISPHDPTAMRRQVKECVRFNLPYFYDVGQQVSNLDGDDLAAGVKSAHLVIVNDYELAVLCEKAKINPSELKARVPVVITTLGKKGSVIEGKSVPKPIKIKSAKPTQVVDPTGAGDAYRAGFLYGFVRGFDLKVCGQMGAVAAVYAIEKHGTQEHVFTRGEFSKRYEATYSKQLEI